MSHLLFYLVLSASPKTDNVSYVLSGENVVNSICSPNYQTSDAFHTDLFVGKSITTNCVNYDEYDSGNIFCRISGPHMCHLFFKRSKKQKPIGDDKEFCVKGKIITIFGKHIKLDNVLFREGSCDKIDMTNTIKENSDGDIHSLFEQQLNGNRLQAKAKR